MLNGHFSNPGAKFSIIKEAKKYRYGLSQIVGELYGNGMVWRDLVWNVAKWYGLSTSPVTVHSLFYINSLTLKQYIK